MFPGLLGLLAIGGLIYFFARRADRHNTIGDAKPFHTIDEQYNADRKSKQETIDRLLDKIAHKGYDSLSAREKELLKEHSASLH